MSSQEFPYVLNVANSIMGVSVLAMPFCFMKCGLILGSCLLILSTYLTTVTCELLMRSATSSKRRSYEFLAKHIFGAPGKFAVELGIAGIQLGICIAFHVVIGDLGPSLFSKWTGLPMTSTLRSVIMVLSAIFISLPLSLMKKLDSLTNLSAMSIAFYGIVVIYVFMCSLHNLFHGAWLQEVHLWRTENLFQCLPIFAMAFGCQTQMFLLYDNLPDPSITSLCSVTNKACRLCMTAYFFMGISGYIAFYDRHIEGDVLLTFDKSFASDLLRFGFVVSVALSFPLMSFPCRQSLNTLLFSSSQQSHGHGNMPAPMSNMRFNGLTFFIIMSTLLIAINFPDVEFIIGLNGSTMGCLINFIFPALFYLRVMESKPDGKLVAKGVLMIGVLVLCVSTYSTLQSAQIGHSHEQLNIQQEKEISPFQKLEEPNIHIDKKNDEHVENHEPTKPPDKGSAEKVLKEDEKSADRHEPAIPEPPDGRTLPLKNKNSERKADLHKDGEAPHKEESAPRREPANPESPGNDESEKKAREQKEDKVVDADNSKKAQAQLEKPLEKEKAPVEKNKLDSGEKMEKNSAEDELPPSQDEKDHKKVMKELIEKIDKVQDQVNENMKEQGKLLQKLVDQKDKVAGEKEQPAVQQVNQATDTIQQINPQINQANIPQRVKQVNVPQQTILVNQAGQIVDQAGQPAAVVVQADGPHQIVNQQPINPGQPIVQQPAQVVDPQQQKVQAVGQQPVMQQQPVFQQQGAQQILVQPQQGKQNAVQQPQQFVQQQPVIPQPGIQQPQQVIQQQPQGQFVVQQQPQQVVVKQQPAQVQQQQAQQVQQQQAVQQQAQQVAQQQADQQVVQQQQQILHQQVPQQAAQPQVGQPVVNQQQQQLFVNQNQQVVQQLVQNGAAQQPVANNQPLLVGQQNQQPVIQGLQQIVMNQQPQKQVLVDANGNQVQPAVQIMNQQPAGQPLVLNNPPQNVQTKADLTVQQKPADHQKIQGLQDNMVEQENDQHSDNQKSIDGIVKREIKPVDEKQQPELKMEEVPAKEDEGT